MGSVASATGCATPLRCVRRAGARWPSEGGPHCNLVVVGRAEDVARRAAQQRDREARAAAEREVASRDAGLAEALQDARAVMERLKALDYVDGELLSVEYSTAGWFRARYAQVDLAGWCVCSYEIYDRGDPVACDVFLLSDGRYALRRGGVARLIEDLPAFLSEPRSPQPDAFESGMRALAARYP